MSGGLPSWQNPNALFWGLVGNSGTNPATNFLGTTDAQSLVFRTNNVERARFDDAAGGQFVPGSDDTYDLGSPTLRWQDLYLGPASLHFATLASETGTARDWSFGVDTTTGASQGNFSIGEGGTEFISMNTDGYVGINESNPQARIHITHGRFDPIEDQSIRFEIDASSLATGDDYGAIEWYQQSNRVARILSEASTTSRNGALRFFTTDQSHNEIEALTLITDNGTLAPRFGLGVNVSTPPALFTVGPLSTTLIGDGTDSVGVHGFNFRTRDFGHYMVGFHNNDNTATGSHGVLIQAGNVVGNNKSLNVIRAVDNADLLMVRSVGRVGVGQANPNTSLHVTPKSGDDPLQLEGLSTDVSLSDILVVDGAGIVHQRTAASIATSTAWVLGGNTSPSSNILGTLDATDIDIQTNSTTAITVDGTTQDVAVANNLTVTGKITGSSDSTLLGDNTSSQQLIVDGVVDAVVGNTLAANPTVWDAVVDGDMVATGIIKSGGSIWIDGVTAGNHRMAADDNLDIGTTGSDTLTFSVNSARAFTIEPTASNPNIIGGPVSNTVGAGSFGVVVGGGGTNTVGVGTNRATIGGGVANDIGDSTVAVTIGGGSNNDVSAFSDFATIAGGQLHRVDSGALYTFIGGGNGNMVGRDATRNAIVGGGGNLIGDSTINSVIGGGFTNTIGRHGVNVTVGGGVANDIADSAQSVTVSGGSNNDIGFRADYAIIGGGQLHRVDSGAQYATIGGGHGNHIHVNADRNTISGGGGNQIGEGTERSFIGGGFTNLIGEYSSQVVIGGGVSNIVEDSTISTTIGGGSTNVLRFNADYSTIAGGQQNQIDSNAINSFIGGGRGNTIGAGRRYSTISGGFNNAVGVGGNNATIAGGALNIVEDSLIGATIGGGISNQVHFGSHYSVVSGGRANIIDSTAQNSVIGGGFTNSISPLARLSVIAGGGSNILSDSAERGVIGGGSDNVISEGRVFSVIGGGFSNTMGVGGNNATISGGALNVVGDSVIGGTISGGIDNEIEFNAHYSMIGGGQQNLIGSTTAHSVIAGGDSNQIGLDGQFNVVGGGAANQIDSGTAYGFVGGGEQNRAAGVGTAIVGGSQNQIGSSIVYSAIVAGRLNQIDTNSNAAFIGSGNGNTIRINANNTVIAGGLSNLIDSGSAISSIGGGFSNQVGTGSNGSNIDGGSQNVIGDTTLGATIGGGNANITGLRTDYSVIAGGQDNEIGDNANRAVIGGGNTNEIGAGSDRTVISGGLANIIGDGSRLTGIHGGSSNTVGDSVQGGVIGGGNANLLEIRSDFATIGGGQFNAIDSGAGHSVISGGRDNVIDTLAQHSAIAGGNGLTLGGSGSFGFLGGNPGGNDMAVAVADIAVFGNTDMWLANNNNAASQLRFYEPYNVPGDFPSTANYTAFVQSDALASDITYDLPSTLNTSAVSDERFLRATTSTVNTSAQLDWVDATTMVGSVGWLLAGNTGTNPTTDFLGTTDNVDLVIRTNNTESMRVFADGDVSIGTTGSGARFHVVHDHAADAHANAMFGRVTQSVATSANINTTGGLFWADARTTGTIAQATGVVSLGLAASNTALTTAIGVSAEAGVATGQSSASVTDAYAIQTLVRRSGGTVTNGYGVYIQDADATNDWGLYQAHPSDDNYMAGNLGLGTTTPASVLSINNDDVSDVKDDLIITTHSNTFTPLLRMLRARGTEAAPSPLLNNDQIASIAFWDATSPTVGSTIRAFADANHSGTDQSTRLEFSTTNVLSPTVQMVIKANGNVGVGVLSPTQKLHVEDGNVHLSNTNNTAPQIRLSEPSASGTNYTSFRAPIQAANIDYVLPAATGGVGQQLTISAVAGTQVTLGWAAPSDSRLKTDFMQLSGEDVLTKFRDMNLGTWRYKTSIDPKGLRHYGVMAQDFNKAFGRDDLGVIGTDTTVNNIDLHGVSYLAIQGLELRTTTLNSALQSVEEMSAEQTMRIEQLEQENAGLRMRLERLEELLLNHTGEVLLKKTVDRQ